MSESLSAAITRIVDDSGLQGSQVITVIFGQGLDGATAITFAGRGVTAKVIAGGTDAWVPVVLTIDQDAPLGPRRFRVSTPWRTVHSENSDVSFTVRAATGYSSMSGIGGHLL
jgi:hypothetical protein